MRKNLTDNRVEPQKIKPCFVNKTENNPTEKAIEFKYKTVSSAALPRGVKEKI